MGPAVIGLKGMGNLLGDKGGGIISGEERLGRVDGLGEDIILVVADMLSSDGQRKICGVLGR